MKKYYQTLDKETKKEIKAEFQKEYQDSDLLVRLKRISYYIIIAVVFALVLIIWAIFDKTDRILNLSIASILLIASLAFIISKQTIKLNLLNKIALKKKKK